MGLFEKLFGSKKLKTIDQDFGAIERFNINGNRVGWKFNQKFFDTDLEILMEGNKDGIFKSQKKILLDALNNESIIKSEASRALKAQFLDAEMEFIALENHFDIHGISIQENGFELSFQQKEDPFYFFNVYFQNNKSVGVSIDG